ncbi:TetR/AcrR family transcriptional regulator [Isoptericola haloaureus]|uniref:TetR/AcrR family transcriptional regulator n=1 Tax=Isoptericola haloaureus TaxID=1542902 RepID=A0ABU7Z3P7_9MICO
MSTSRTSYHHGDLRAALLRAAVDSLEAGEAFSMRGVARRAGVSPTAPYRHFADREALDAAVAVEAFHDLRQELERAVADLPATAGPVDEIAALGVAYVSFALRRPAVFRLMFGHECDDENDERVRAARELHVVLDRVVERSIPAADVPSLSTALWGLAHGLAFLHLDGKLPPGSDDEVAARVRTSVAAILAVGVDDRHPETPEPAIPARQEAHP